MENQIKPNNQQRILSQSKDGGLLNEKGEKLIPPEGWIFLKAGDAGVTRKVTDKKIFWRIQVKKGRRFISLGVWAPEENIVEAYQLVEQMRQSPSYQKKRDYDLKRREQKQASYEHDFCMAVENFLHFDKRYHQLQTLMAKTVTQHAIPVGSGTVARTIRIPLEERAAKAVIAWMRHQTTAYDNLKIPHIKGERRAVRRQLAAHSVVLLSRYRKGVDSDDKCPLKNALADISR